MFDPVEKETHLIKEHIRASQDRIQSAVQAIANTVIRDRLPSPLELKFGPAEDFFGYDGKQHALLVAIEKDRVPCTIHAHALRQISAKVGVPMQYIHLLNQASEGEWRRRQLGGDLTNLFHKSDFTKRGGEPTKFLLRFVGQELRGFMSRSFNRHLASTPTLRAFLDACRVCEALPADVSLSPVRYSLSAYVPVVFSPVANQPIAIGVRWTNSDFGAGKLSIALTVLHARRGGSMVLSEEFSKVHLGAIIQESDIEMSAETEAKELEAVASAIKDTVVGQLKPESIQKLLKAIERASEAEVDWLKLKGQLRKYLYDEELKTVEAIARGEKTGHLDLPPPGTDGHGNPIPSKWWAATTLSWMAEQLDDLDRKADLQQEAGKFLEAK